MKLILFDIDGTMLLTYGMGRESVVRSLSELTGQDITTEGVVFSGKTDPQIIREVMRANDLLDLVDAPFLAEAQQAYSDALTAAYDHDRVEELAGVRELVEALAARDDVQLSLLTGNYEQTAYLKVGSIGLGHHFPFGAFGSDAEARRDLPPIGVKRAQAHTGRSFEGHDVIIIGDTEHDITCGRDLGVYSVAVATGNYSREDLAAHQPNLLLDDLCDPQPIFDIL
ncbi:MAG: HAD family hydrolase [Rhodothermales bacterium]